MKRVYHVCDPGDRSVGIPILEATVTFEDEWDDIDADEIMEEKVYIATIYDVSIKSVKTDEEYKASEQQLDLECDNVTIGHDPEKCGCKYVGFGMWDCGHMDSTG